MKIKINGYVILTKDKEILISKIDISEKAWSNLPKYSKDLFDFYKNFVIDSKCYKTRAKKIDEKYLKRFLKEKGFN